ncbi:LAFA_0F06656g1_1 [Lachancea sp. 'fantastica']|nr:LAFA_0F06656g1_1 [Lachancea sp. 'fantastica']
MVRDRHAILGTSIPFFLTWHSIFGDRSLCTNVSHFKRYQHPACPSPLFLPLLCKKSAYYHPTLIHACELTQGCILDLFDPNLCVLFSCERLFQNKNPQLDFRDSYFSWNIIFAIVTTLSLSSLESSHQLQTCWSIRSSLFYSHLVQTAFLQVQDS